MNLATAKTHGRNVPATTFIIYRAKLNYTNKRSLGRFELLCRAMEDKKRPIRLKLGPV